MENQTFIFECSSSTYLDCVEKNLFGSNKPWPLEIKTGDYCLLHHYEIGGLLGLWQATTNGGKNLVPEDLGREVSVSGQSEAGDSQGDRCAEVGAEETWYRCGRRAI